MKKLIAILFIVILSLPLIMAIKQITQFASCYASAKKRYYCNEQISFLLDKNSVADKNEIKINGSYFDIFEKKEIGDKILISGVFDEQEDLLSMFFDEIFNDKNKKLSWLHYSLMTSVFFNFYKPNVTTPEEKILYPLTYANLTLQNCCKGYTNELINPPNS